VGTGIAGFIFVPTARVWGKRHAYLLGTLLLIVSCAWGGAAKSYRSFLWSRVIQGVALAPFESLVNASIGDL
jgi:predicted MFS family arabinose efflux permease